MADVGVQVSAPVWGWRATLPSDGTALHADVSWTQARARLAVALHEDAVDQRALDHDPSLAFALQAAHAELMALPMLQPFDVSLGGVRYQLAVVTGGNNPPTACTVFTIIEMSDIEVLQVQTRRSRTEADALFEQIAMELHAVEADDLNHEIASLRRFAGDDAASVALYETECPTPTGADA